MYKTISVGNEREGHPFSAQCFARIDELVATGVTDGTRSMTHDGHAYTIIRTWTDQASAQGWIDWVTANAPSDFSLPTMTIAQVSP